MLSGKQKLFFLVNRIRDARDITPSKKPIRIHPANDLKKQVSEQELEYLLEKLEKEEKIITTTKKPEAFWDLEGIDPDAGCYLLKTTAKFDNYLNNLKEDPDYQSFTGIKTNSFNNDEGAENKTSIWNDPSERRAVAKQWQVIQYLQERRHLEGNKFKVYFWKIPPSIKDFSACLRGFENDKILRTKSFGSGADYNSRGVEIEFEKVRFELHYRALKLKDEDRASYEELRNKVARGIELREKDKQSKGKSETNIAYLVNYSKIREIAINGLVIAKPDFDSENDIVFDYLFKNPNKKITKQEIEEETKRALKKNFHNIISDLKFKGDLGKAFFSISKTSIMFRNPITNEDMDEIGLKWLNIYKEEAKSKK